MMEVKQHTKNKSASMIVNPTPEAIEYLDKCVGFGSAKRFESGNYLLKNHKIAELNKAAGKVAEAASVCSIEISVSAIQGALNHPYRLQGGKLTVHYLDLRTPIQDDVSEVTSTVIDGAEVVHSTTIDLRKAYKALQDGKEINLGGVLKRAFFQRSAADTVLQTI